jgi:DNA-directed RNA polymerase subunit RPC12/RpoP
MNQGPPRVPEGLSARCARCGGTFGFVPTGPSVRCPYCGHEQRLSRELDAELRRYGGAVAHELSRADQAYERAASWQHWSEQSSRAVPRLKVVIPLLSGITLCVSVAFPLSQALGIPPDQVGVVLTPLLIVPSFFMFGYIIYLYSGARGRAQRAVAGSVAVACPNCGGSGEIVPGAPGQVCGYCGALLIASAPVMQHGLSAAELAHRRARLEEFRHERTGMANLSRYDMSPYILYIVGGSFLFPLGAGTIAFSAGMLSGTEPYSPAIFIMWAMFLGLLFTLAGMFLYRRSRIAGYRSAISDLGHQFATRALADAAEVVDWLNRYWPARYELENLRHGHFFVAARFEIAGYPALLNADFTQGQHHKPRLHLLLSAHLPATANPSADSLRQAHAALARCRQLGFNVTANEAGLHAVADPETLEIARNFPASLHQVATVFTTMARGAQASGAVPGAVS